MTKPRFDISSKARPSSSKTEKAIPALLQAHRGLEWLGSSKGQHPAEYLEKIQQVIGEARFRAFSGRQPLL